LLTDVPLVLDEHNVEFLATNRTGRFSGLWPYVYTIEKNAIQNATLILAVSNVDAKIIHEAFRVPASKIFVAPNGVDSKRFSGLDRSHCRRFLGLPLNARLIVFHGNFISLPNEEAAMVILRRIVPIIIDSIQNSLFAIVGPNPSTRMLAEAKRYNQVIVTDFVRCPEYYIGAADICIAPLLRGAGTKLKVLEYLSAGKPIVCTPPAAEGLDLIDGQQALVRRARADADFVDAICSLLKNKRFGLKLGDRAREHAARYDWRIICKELYEKYQGLVHS